MFQLGLAVLKINQAALLASRDDDQVVRTLKTYFSLLDDHLPQNGEKRRTMTGLRRVPPSQCARLGILAANPEVRLLGVSVRFVCARGGGAARRRRRVPVALVVSELHAPAALSEVMTLALRGFAHLRMRTIHDLRDKFRLQYDDRAHAPTRRVLCTPRR